MTQTRAGSRGPHGWRLGAPGGVPVYIARSWPILVLVIVAYFGPQLQRALPGSGAYLVAAAYALVLLVTVLAHEGAHAAAARLSGYHVQRIVIDVFGGHTAYETAHQTPGRSAVVAAVGPVANGVLAGLCLLVLPYLSPGVPTLLVAAAVWTNALIAAFNLLPGLPLDGGFLLDSLVWKATGRRHLGLLVAGWAGRALVAVLVLWVVVLPFVRGTPPSFLVIAWAGLIGALLWTGASSAIASAAATRQVERLDVSGVLRPAITVPADLPLHDVLRRVQESSGVAVVVLDAAGEPDGVLASVPDAAFAGDEQVLAAPASAFCVRQPPGWVLDARTHDPTPTEILAAMQRASAAVVLLRRAHDVAVVRADDLHRRTSAPPARP